MKRFLLSFALFLVSMLYVNAQFSPGNIVVSRVGDGSTALSNASAQVQLVEYTTAGVPTGTIVTLPIASGGAGNRACTNSGSSTTEGFLTQSYEGRYLVHTGYDVAPGLASVATSTTDPNRSVVRIDASGTVNNTTSFLATPGNGYVRSNIRSAFTYDGTQFWASGTSSSTTGGVRYLALGDDGLAGGGTQISTTSTNTRGVQIFNDQLYISTASLTFRIATVGTGMPTTSGQTITNLPPNVPTTLFDPVNFIFFDRDASVAGPDLLYVACQSTIAGNFGLYKYSFDGTTWTAQGSIQTNAELAGITGCINCSGSVVLYVTRSTTGSTLSTELRQFTDNAAYNATITSNGADFLTVSSLLQTAAANYGFRGIAISPANGYTVTGVQAITAGNYNIIRVKSGGTATLTGNITVYDKIVVESGGTLDMGAFTFSSPLGIGSSFEVQSGSRIKIGSADGITVSAALGNVQTCFRTYNAGANYEYVGTVTQTSGDGLPATITGSLKINNTSASPSSGVTLSQATTISGTFEIINGNTTLGPNNLIVNSITQTGTPSLTNNHIVTNVLGSLKIKAVGAGPISFPVGPSSDSLNTLSITNGGGVDYTVRVEKGINPGISFPTYGINRTWNIFASTNTSGVQVTFWYYTADANPGVVPGTDQMEVLLYSGSAWSVTPGNINIIPAGSNPWTVTTVSPAGNLTISTTPVPYALGKNGGWILPIDCIISTRAQKRNNTGIISWTVNSCAGVTNFEVQRSVNNSGFQTIGTVNPVANQTDFSFTDAALAGGRNLYRIKVNRFTGASKYSNTVALIHNSNDILISSLAPNPVHNKAMLTVSAGRNAAIDFKIYNAMGNLVKQWGSVVIEGNNTIEVNAAGLAAGMYTVFASSKESTTVSRFVKQ